MATTPTKSLEKPIREMFPVQIGSSPGTTSPEVRIRPCLCGSPEICSKLAMELGEFAPDGDPWKGRFEFTRNTSSLKQNVFFECVCHHLKPKVDVNVNRRKYWLYKHHFSKELLQQLQDSGEHVSTPITATLIFCRLRSFSTVLSSLVAMTLAW